MAGSETASTSSAENEDETGDWGSLRREAMKQYSGGMEAWMVVASEIWSLGSIKKPLEVNDHDYKECPDSMIVCFSPDIFICMEGKAVEGIWKGAEQ